MGAVDPRNIGIWEGTAPRGNQYCSFSPGAGSSEASRMVLYKMIREAGGLPGGRAMGPPPAGELAPSLREPVPSAGLPGREPILRGFPGTRPRGNHPRNIG